MEQKLTVLKQTFIEKCPQIDTNRRKVTFPNQLQDLTIYLNLQKFDIKLRILS